jgi:hypothetical protein
MDSLRRNAAAIGDSAASRGQDAVSEITDTGTYPGAGHRRGDDETSAGATWEEQRREPPAKRRRVAPISVATEARRESIPTGRVPPLETVIARHEVVGELLHRGLRREFGDEYDTALREGLPTPYDSSDGEDHRRPDGTSSEDALMRVIAQALRNEGIQYTARDPMTRTATVSAHSGPREPAGPTPTGSSSSQPGTDRHMGVEVGMQDGPTIGVSVGALAEPRQDEGDDGTSGHGPGTTDGGPVQLGPGTGTRTLGEAPTNEAVGTMGTTARRPARGGARTARQSGRGSRGTGRR